MKSSRWLAILCIFLSAQFFFAACGDDDGTTPGDTSSSSSSSSSSGDTASSSSSGADTASSSSSGADTASSSSSGADTTSSSSSGSDMSDTSSSGSDMTDTSSSGSDMTDMTDTSSGCTPTSDVEVSWEACNDNADNDCNELTDYEEEGCSICPPPGDSLSGAEDTEAACTDGIDNDCNGFFDCQEDACAAFCPAEDTDALCSDGIDNDGDGRVDCLGRSCGDTAVCNADPLGAEGSENTEALCSDGVNNDTNADGNGDGRVDCDDFDCAGIGACAAAGGDEVDVTDGCTDGVDNDGNGFVDCNDFTCHDDTACNGAENDDATCSDGIDNNSRNGTDCADPGCYANPMVTVCFNTVEICDDANGDDEDHDGFANCTDPQCEATCETQPCAPTNLFGTCSEPNEVCSGSGTCLPPTPTTAGQIVITEIMQNPSATSDADGEYFEIFNPSSTDSFNLFNCELTSNTDGPYTIDADLVIGPNEYGVLAKSSTPGFTPDYVYASGLNLGNGSDDISITCGGVVIDIVAYDGGTAFPDPTGASMNLNPNNLNSTDNDTGGNWCTSTTDLGNTDLGTPGAANDACSAP